MKFNTLSVVEWDAIFLILDPSHKGRGGVHIFFNHGHEWL